MDDVDGKVEVPHTTQNFLVVFNKLCQEYGITIQPELGFKQQIDGTFTITVRLKVIPLPAGYSNIP
jgi:hypothetical protein